MREFLKGTGFIVAAVVGTLQFGFASRNASATEIKITSLVQQTPGAIPLIGLTADQLVVAQTATRKILIYKMNAATGAVVGTRVLTGGAGARSVATHPSGWAAVCSYLGLRVTTFNVALEGTLRTRELPDEQLMCSGMSIVRDGPGKFALWIGSPTNLSVFNTDFATGDIRKAYRGISGAFELARTKNFVFTSNQLIYPDFAIPFVFDPANGQGVVGDRLGSVETQAMNRGYGQQVFDDEAGTGRVYYIRTDMSEAQGLSTAAPAVTPIFRQPIGVTRPVALSRFGRCIVAMGQTPDANSRPSWSVFLAQGSGAWTLLRQTQPTTDTSVNGAYRQMVDSGGNLYVSHWKGVSQVSGVTDGLGCELN